MMDIENFISKQVLDYQQKIEDCNILLNNAEVQNRQNRRNNESMDFKHETICEMRVLNAKLIAFGQMKVELNSILQEVAE
jgi:isopentenyl diphosphate isomerase/L-lactate dehydrogenase-like FMN-dependent dehydrogenase